MKTAMLLSGMPRFSIEFDSTLEYLVNSEIDVYIALWKTNSINDPKVSANWQEIEVAEDVRDLIQPYLPERYKIKHIELVDPFDFWVPPRDYTPMNSSPFNVWQQYNILKICDQRRKESGIVYDLVMRARPDVGISHPIDLQLVHNILKERPMVILTPDNYRCGYPPHGFCDQFAIGLAHTMTTYCEAVYYYDQLYSEGVDYNPECLLQTVLDKHGIIYPTSNFQISRGGYWQPINHGRWADLKISRLINKSG